MSGGECKAFHRVATEICGLTEADQALADDLVESGVGACKWRRPQARTPSCQDLRAEIEDLRRETARPAPAPPPSVKPSLLKRLREKFKKKAATGG